jgi:formylglycine-generating enzyme required for sulfatase activity
MLEEGLVPAYRMPGYQNSTDPAAWGPVPVSNNATWNAVELVPDSNGYRLPTEAQWEYACRAGTTTAFNNGNNEYTNTAEVGAVGWYTSNSGARTHPVGEKAANVWGLYDMHGNVFEFCWDLYDLNYGGAAGEAATDPVVDVSTWPDHVRRGGSYLDYGNEIRSAFRDNFGPSGRHHANGFRLVRPL